MYYINRPLYTFIHVIVTKDFFSNNILFLMADDSSIYYQNHSIVPQFPNFSPTQQVKAKNFRDKQAKSHVSTSTRNKSHLI